MDRWLLKALWWIPLAFAVVVAGVGAYAYRTLEGTTREALRSSLETILQADVAALQMWVEAQTTAARAAAHDSELRAPVDALLALWREERDPAAALLAAPAAAQIAAVLRPEIEVQGFLGYGVLAHDGTVLASLRTGLLGHRFPATPQLLESVMGGDTVLIRPARRMSDRGGNADAGSVVLHVATPLRDSDGRPIAILGFAIDAAGDFTRVLSTARMGESGETYAFDENAQLLSSSRFESQLVELGLIEAEGDAILRVEIRDPGGNLIEGFVPSLPLRARPLTRMAASAISGGAGSDIDGYPDYRGVPVVGAWTWLPDLGLGVATEIDVAEAYLGLSTVRRSFAALASVLVLAALSLLVYSLVLSRVQRRYERARKLGSYRIEEKIGEGGMGVVYRARHSLLRRPTAVKLLAPERATEESIKRFEREVQAIASLTHPNTIAVYDFGRTPDDTFYYAMEYLEGITLSDLVAGDGAQLEARVVHILTQAAGSLAEAHTIGLVHRDLKPSNLMLCVRGGLLDFVKVLDFGLVRGQEDDLQLTTTRMLTGTPQFLSPEALEAPETVDMRSDVYQLGAIAYFLLTGRPVFQGETLVELLTQHLHTVPRPPSAALGHPVSPDLEALILACLEKDREKRPQSGAALLLALEACRVDGVWTQSSAASWWEEWTRVHGVSSHDFGSQGSLPSGWQIDPRGRSRSV